MKKHHPAAARYQKIVYWSDEDGGFVGQCPGLFGGGCHGTDEAKVYAELLDIVDEHLAILDADGDAYPPATSKDFSGTFALRIDAGLHRILAARAAANGDSLNGYIARALAAAVNAKGGRGGKAPRRTTARA